MLRSWWVLETQTWFPGRRWYSVLYSTFSIWEIQSIVDTEVMRERGRLHYYERVCTFLYYVQLLLASGMPRTARKLGRERLRARQGSGTGGTNRKHFGSTLVLLSRHIPVASCPVHCHATRPRLHQLTYSHISVQCPRVCRNRSTLVVLPSYATIRGTNFQPSPATMPDKTINVSSTAHFNTLLSSATYTIVDFYADWCGPCKTIAPVFHALAEKESKPGRLQFVKVNVDAQQDIAKKYGVSA